MPTTLRELSKALLTVQAIFYPTEVYIKKQGEAYAVEEEGWLVITVMVKFF